MRIVRVIREFLREALGVALLTAVAAANETTRASVESSGAEGNGASRNSAISADGQFVAFKSKASDLVAGDTNDKHDIFVHDRATGNTERVSVDSSGTEADDNCYEPVISADGRFVAFHSEATNLVAGDTNGSVDVFVHDRVTGITERVSVNSNGKQGGSSSYQASISGDGQIVAFASEAPNLVLGDVNWGADIFVRDRSTSLTTLVSVDSSGKQANSTNYAPAISADGKVVAFGSWASNLVAGDGNGDIDVFVHDLGSGVTERVSVDSAGAEANYHCFEPSISADGQVVAFHSIASNLVAGDTNGNYDVFVRDRSTGITERVSVDATGAEGDSFSAYPSISADGQLVAFSSGASNLVAGDTGGNNDVFLFDRATALVVRVSVDSSGAEGNDGSYAPSIAADGDVVAFESAATNLVGGDTNAFSDVFVHEHCLAAAAWSNYGAGWPGTLGIPTLAASADPVLGTTITLDVGNSIALSNVGLLLAGLDEQSLPLRNSGTLLVDDFFLLVPIVIAPSGSSFPAAIPDDHALCGVSVFFQVIELDAGASNGFSFTPGLELVFGH